MKTTTKKVPVLFGEVLFDTFDDGSRNLGGAPFNVAWHLKAFGLEPILISRVGADAQGDLVREAMERWNMDTRGLQVDHSRSTGAVSVAITAGQPKFNILPDQAYDHIEEKTARGALDGITPSVIYQGTLVTRSAQSRDALTELRRQYDVPAFVDLNLRAPWWDHTLVWHALRGAQWVKLNEDELHIVNQNNDPHEASIETIARKLKSKFDLSVLIVTLGEKGAFALTQQDLVRTEPVGVERLVDTVGAGDGFSAVSIYGLLNGWPIQQTVQRAAQFAALVCSNRGATISDTAVYRELLREWSA